MKHLKTLSKMLLIVILTGTIFGVYSQARAQQEIVNYLDERLKQENVPVTDVSVLQKFPMQLQVSIQSSSDGEKATPDDPINLGLVHREVLLASRRGYLVERFTIILLNNQGKPMSMVEHSVDIENIFLDVSPSKIADNTTISIISNKMNFYGMSAKNMDISSSEGLQVISLQLSVPSVEDANQALPHFMPSLRPLVEEINGQGAHIVMVKLDIRDNEGNILLKYLFDLQLRFENWWMADGITMDWFPHPAP